MFLFMGSGYSSEKISYLRPVPASFLLASIQRKEDSKLKSKHWLWVSLNTLYVLTLSFQWFTMICPVQWLFWSLKTSPILTSPLGT